MLISLNWLKDYVDIKIPTNELVTLIGARLVEVEGIIDQTHKYDNIFAVRVISCEQIPETHLSLCQIDTGTKNLQVLCGAPNVRKGMMAAWIAPGATVPSSINDQEPFVIAVRKMRGHESHGMLASASELDLGEDSAGIIELDPKSSKPGDSLSDLFDLNDTILEIENKSLTHRPDTFGVIGFAREVAGILHQEFKTPDFLLDEAPDFLHLNPKTNLKIKIADQKICSRYTALLMKKNPTLDTKYLTRRDTLLSRSGMRLIDPIVDLTNYLMLLTGQPLHAFDYDKLISLAASDQVEIIVRTAKPGEKLELIDTRELELTENDILITANDKAIALAGAMGGKNTEIDQNTKHIIIESASFSLYNLRKTQMTHGIFSEAVTRFTKGQPAFQTLPVLKKFTALSSDFLESTSCIDYYPNPAHPNTIEVAIDKINLLLGTDYSASQMQSTLENVGFTVGVNSQSLLTCTAPLWRTDIHIEEDIIEEIGRLNGYDNISPTLPLHATAIEDPLLQLKSKIRHILSSFGANEVLTYSFLHGDLLKKFEQDPRNSYKIANSISPDLQYIRQQIAPSLFVKAYENLKDNYSRFALFEMNQVFLKSNGLNQEAVPILNNNLALVFADKSQDNTCYYQAKHYLEQLATRLGLKLSLKPIPVKHLKMCSPTQFGLNLRGHQIPKVKKYQAFYEPKRSANIFINDHQVGIIGELKHSVAHSLKLPLTTSSFELSLDAILDNSINARKNFQFTQFPFVNRDISLDLSVKAAYADILDKIHQVFQTTKLISCVSPVSIYQKSPTRKTLTFHLQFAHPTKTLSGLEINDIMGQLESIK